MYRDVFKKPQRYKDANNDSGGIED